MNKEYSPTYGKLAAMGVIVLFMVSSWYIVLPYISSVIEKVELKNELREQIAFSNSSEKTYDELVSYRSELEDGLESLQQKKLKHEEVYLAIEHLYKISKDSFIQIKRVEPEQQSQSTDETQRYKLEFIGRYHNIGRFINQIENSEFHLEISTLRLEKEDQSEKELQGELTFELSLEEGDD